MDHILKSKQIVRKADLKPPPKEFWDQIKKTVVFSNICIRFLLVNYNYFLFNFFITSHYFTATDFCCCNYDLAINNARIITIYLFIYIQFLFISILLHYEGSIAIRGRHR